ncbi:MAG: hypothetical protein ABSA47_06505, partial [Verrucomicrobiota bacterium]
ARTGRARLGPIKSLALGCAAFLLFLSPARAQTETVAGPLYSDFRLTLDSGRRQEVLGPLFYTEQSDAHDQWALAPLFSHTRTPAVDWTEADFLYPLFTWRRFGSEYRVQFFQLLSLSGGKTQEGPDFDRFTVFPLFFEQHSTNSSLDYTALVPFYGHLRDRLFRNEIQFVLFPLYSRTRAKDVVTDNYLYPLIHLRQGDHLHGWQFWPFVGAEHKTPTLATNNLQEVQTVGGHERFFAAWPFYVKDLSGLGTTNQAERLLVFPFYSSLRSPLRDESSYGWPFGYWRVEDRDKDYREQDFLWPLFVFARGGKTETRVFPFYSHAAAGGLESDFYLWPIYKHNLMESGTLERERVRIAYFLYSDLREQLGTNGPSQRRVDFWPFFTWRRDMDQTRRLQVLAPLEPFFSNNRGIAREYSLLWSLWRAERNGRTGASSQSLLWNLYRRESTPESKKYSLFFGLFQYQSSAQGATWRVCHVPIVKRAARAAAPGG